MTSKFFAVLLSRIIVTVTTKQQELSHLSGVPVKKRMLLVSTRAAYSEMTQTTLGLNSRFYQVVTLDLIIQHGKTMRRITCIMYSLSCLAIRSVPHFFSQIPAAEKRH